MGVPLVGDVETAPTAFSRILDVVTALRQAYDHCTALLNPSRVFGGSPRENSPG
jgi:hypothetical protein